MEQETREAGTADRRARAPGADAATAVTTRIALRPGGERAFAAWQSSFTRAAAEAPGFLALDIAATAEDGGAWEVLQRFRSAEALARWRADPARGRLLDELAAMQAGGGAPRDEAVPGFDPLAGVTEVITTVVERGREDEYLAWSERLQAAQATFPGYAGTLVQAPVSAEMAYWTTLVRFATPAQLDAWLGAPERARLLKRVAPGVATWKSYRLASPFAGWFPASETQPAPPAWKQSALVLLVLFPVVMLEIRFLSPLLATLNVAAATFLGNALSVALTSWPLMRIAVAGMGWWLQARRARMEAAGIAAMVLLYAAELALFTWLF